VSHRPNHAKATNAAYHLSSQMAAVSFDKHKQGVDLYCITRELFDAISDKLSAYWEEYGDMGLSYHYLVS